jgi:Na+-translocating ferredoxin:NAD+ oxidoreductase subunit C
MYLQRIKEEMRSMAFLTFRGGIHPYDGKDLSKNCPVEKYLPKGDLAILVSQHIGAPAKPIVKKGDHVLAGQKIAEAGGFVSAPIHSSVSGTVKGIEKRLTAVGAMGDAIIIENDGLYESVEYTPAKLSDLSKEDILKRIQEGGVVGQGGAGFPTHVKLSPKEPDKIDHILVNGAECEPYITSDYRRMMEEPESVVGGLEVILKAFPKAVGCICIEDNKPDCIAKMKEAIKGKERMEVKELKTKYPQGGERTLIYAVTGREINSTMLPADVGCVVDNVETVTSVYKAVILGQPVISRNVTVTGDGIRTPKNFSVLTGTDLSELVDAAGGLKEKIAKAISGRTGSCISNRNDLCSESFSGTKDLSYKTNGNQTDGKSKSHSKSVKDRWKDRIFGSITLCTSQNDTVNNDQRNINSK